MNLVTGYFGKPHISTNQDSMWHRGIWNSDCIIAVNGTENLAADIVSNNEIQVKSGVLQMQGRFSEIPFNTYDSLSINNGTVGENRIDLIVCHYEKDEDTKVESTTLKVIQGTPSTATPSVPTYTEGNIDNGDLVAELPVFQVNIEGINITSVDTLIDISPAFTDNTAELLFDGAIESGSLTLNKSMYNYSYLVIGINTSISGAPYGWAFYPVLPNEALSAGYQAFAGFNSQNEDPHQITTYSGRLINTSDTVLRIESPITNVGHTSGSNHNGASTYYIRQIWGKR